MKDPTCKPDPEDATVDPLRQHYGRKAARRSFRHFLVGKGAKTVTSLATLLLLARWLTTPEYAAYIALRALVEVARVLTAIGVTAVLYRYLPELRASGNNHSAYRLLGYGLGIRVGAIALIFMLAMPFMTELGIQFNLADWIWLIPWFLIVGGLDFISHTLSQSLESFLWQKEAQYSLAAGNLVNVTLLISFAFSDGLTLPTAVVAEGTGHVVAILLQLYGLYRRWRSDEQRYEGDQTWFRGNLRRMFRFGAWTFGLNLTRVAYGPGPNRLIASRYLPVADVAAFGFAGQLANLGRRLMPSKLVATMIRPLLLARFSVSGDFDRLVHMINLVYRINVSLLVVPIGMLLVGGKPLIGWITGGKYEEAALLLAGFLFLLIAEGMRGLLELVIQAVEKNQILAGSNLVQSLSLLLAIPLIGVMGAWGLLMANLCGTVCANLVLIVWLRRHGYVFSVSWGPVVRVLLYGTLAMLAGLGLVYAVGPDLFGLDRGAELLGLLVVPAVFGTLYLLRPPFSADELDVVMALVKKKRRSRAQPDASMNRDVETAIVADVAEEKI